MRSFDAIFFDLDGTLLPMDLEEFTQTYFGLLANHLGMDPKVLVPAIWSGTKAMMANDGTMTNEERFWSVFSRFMGSEIREREPEFARFYVTDFHQAKAVTGANPLAKAVVELARKQASTVVLATNPLFPRCGVESRLSWVGLKPEDFHYVTTYENSSFCKPAADYYLHICRTLNLDPTRCLMIGNDLREDGQGASQIGMNVHIVTDSLIAHDLKLEDWPHSTFAELADLLT